MCEDDTSMLTTDENYSECTVSNENLGDIYPIWFYNQTVEPATNAARYILNTSK